MELNLKNKVALVTGAGRGLGKAIAVSLANESAKVILVSRTKKYLEESFNAIGGSEKGHMMIQSDLMEEGSADKVLSKILESYDTIDILVNNVGGDLFIKDPFCSIDDWRKVWRINMEVPIEFSNLVIPMMKNNSWGRIVNISSIASQENQGAVPYCSIKAALTAYSRSMGRVVAEDGIIITSVLPGAVFTEGGYWDYSSKNNPAHVEKYLNERMAIKRFGKPEEISNFVAFLCSDHASFCVGSMIPIDGGQGRCFFKQD